jgi:membrane protein required for colicin V production
MSALDIFVIVLLGGGAIIGFVRGLVHEMLSLLAWVVAIVMLRLFHTPISVSLTDSVGSATGAAVVAFVVLLLPSFSWRTSPPTLPTDRTSRGRSGCEIRAPIRF